MSCLHSDIESLLEASILDPDFEDLIEQALIGVSPKQIVSIRHLRIPPHTSRHYGCDIAVRRRRASEQIGNCYISVAWAVGVCVSEPAGMDCPISGGLLG